MATTAIASKPLAVKAPVTAAVTPAVNDFQPINASGGAITATLPALSSTLAATSAVVVVEKASTDTSANIVTVACAGSDAFASGGTSIALKVAGEKLELQAAMIGGTVVWKVLRHHIPLSALDARYQPKATGTPDGTKFLGDDGSWRVPPTGGGGSGNVSATNAAKGDSVAYDTTSSTYKPVKPKGANVLNGVTQFGMVGDGTTDNLAAMQAMLTAAKQLRTDTGRDVVMYVPQGTYAVTTPASGDFCLAWGSGLSLIGEGKWATRFVVTSNSSATTSQSFIMGTAGSSSSPYTNCHFEHFELDMTAVIAPSTYNPIRGKGFYMQYCALSSWSNLVVRGTKATGIGVDFLVNCEIKNNHVLDCGNFTANPGAGDSGIGIGSGAYQDEYCVISGNIVQGSRNHGIFIEKQGSAQTFWSRGFLVVGNTCKANRVGIGDKGGQGATFVGNIVCDNLVAGISIAYPEVGSGDNEGRETLISTNTILGNAVGVEITGKFGRYVVRGNRIAYSTDVGVSLKYTSTSAPSATDCPRYIGIIDNDIHDNASNGIVLGAVGATVAFINDLLIERNRIFNNVTGGSTSAYGIRIKANVQRLRLVGNVLWDDNATKKQTTGINILTGCTITDGLIQDNDGRGCTTPMAIAATLAGNLVIRNNPGYTGGGPVAVTATASPMTYTAGRTPERVYIDGGTVSSVAKAGVTLRSSTGCLIELSPNESIVITYSAVPNIVADRV
ncbi:MAG: right-handed parallel beta-helix repeat-containing protein [Gordonia polyisoprenivorans]|nr:right-handed parallel beta-helix repeat-containing protein [Gordonia polyisoprenivorans]